MTTIRMVSGMTLSVLVFLVAARAEDPDLERTVAVLVKALGDEDARGRQAGVSGLIRLGPKALPAMKKELEKTKPPVRDRLRAVIATLERAVDQAASNPGIIKKWDGFFIDEELRKQEPAGGIIRDQESLEKLCKAWEFTGVPKVDWNNEFILVITAKAKSKIGLAKPIELKGDDLQFETKIQEVEGKGFNYIVAHVGPATKIKTINGKPLPAFKPAEKPQEKPDEKK
ncbi:MAG: HEAT repeat domain-containing protein [Gemmataceae bacterium]